MNGSVRVKTVTYGRKVPVERGGNAEYILTADVESEQTVEDVMASLRKIVKNQLELVKNEDEEDCNDKR